LQFVAQTCLISRAISGGIVFVMVETSFVVVESPSRIVEIPSIVAKIP
jgi:hypothetical protein